MLLRPEQVISADQPGRDPDERTRAVQAISEGTEGDGLPLKRWRRLRSARTVRERLPPFKP